MSDSDNTSIESMPFVAQLSLALLSLESTACGQENLRGTVEKAVLLPKWHTLLTGLVSSKVPNIGKSAGALINGARCPLVGRKIILGE
jgi:hypothetical protein